MNSQPASSYPNSYPDARIDQVLDALRATEPPTGLEQRIAARLAQAAEARTLSSTPSPSPRSYATVVLNTVKNPYILLAPARRYSVAIPATVAILIALTVLAFVHHRTPTKTAQTASTIDAPFRVPHLRDGSIVAQVGIAPSATAIPSFEGSELQSRHTLPPTSPASTAEGTSHPLSPAAQDPDAIALAETLAPSRPAPPMPLTAQEKLIQAATRPGQPIQLAELDLARAPVLQAQAEARETATMDRYVKSLLAPFAIVDALSPATGSQPQQAHSSAPADPTSNPSN